MKPRTRSGDTERRIGSMANYLPKGIERMRALGRLGAVKSAEVRRRNAIELRLIHYAVARASTGCTWEELMEAVRPLDLSSGNHDTDWRCPKCHHFTSTNRWMCAQCFSPAPARGRLTRARLRERQEQSGTGAGFEQTLSEI